jgi:hypothetical protein
MASPRRPPPALLRRRWPSPFVHVLSYRDAVGDSYKTNGYIISISENPVPYKVVVLVPAVGVVVGVLRRPPPGHFLRQSVVHRVVGVAVPFVINALNPFVTT